MVLVPNNQAFNADASGTLISSLAGEFKTAMDTVMLGGRDITIHLPAQKSPCPDASCRFVSVGGYRKHIRNDGQLCRTCRGQGFFFEQRQTVYRANIRWTDEDLANSLNTGQDTVAGRTTEALVRTKTVADSFNHIQQAIGAQIDGVPVELWGEPRYTGFGGSVFYVVAFWKRTNKKTSV